MPGTGKKLGDSQAQRKSSRIQEKNLAAREDVNPAQNSMDGTEFVSAGECTGVCVGGMPEARDRDLGESGEVHDHAHATDSVGKTGSVHEKLDRIMAMLEGVVGRLDIMEAKLNGLESDYNVSKGKIEKVEESLNFVTKEVSDLKVSCIQENKVTREALEKRCDDLENRSKRKNLVIWNIPEGSEDRFEKCAEFVLDLLKNTMKMDRVDEIEIERAHRSPAGKKARAQFEKTTPRPIHVAFLRFQDRERILRSAASALKGKKVNGKIVYVTDDVAKSIRADRKRLIPKRNELRAQDLFAVIPYSVPACVLYKTREGIFKKISVKDLKNPAGT